VRQTGLQIFAPWNELSAEYMMIEFLTIEDYHDIPYYRQRQFRPITIPVPTAAAVLFCSARNWVEDYVEVAFLPIMRTYSSGLWTVVGEARTRYQSLIYSPHMTWSYLNCKLQLPRYIWQHSTTSLLGSDLRVSALLVQPSQSHFQPPPGDLQFWGLLNVFTPSSSITFSNLF
jgi:hypothetical protein